MEAIIVIILVISLVAGFVWTLGLKSRIDFLSADVRSLRLNDENLRAEVENLRARIDGLRRHAKRRPVATNETAASESPVVRALAPTRDSGMLPVVAEVAEPARTLLEEAVPEVAVASAVIGIAQQAARGPSLTERAVSRLRGTEEWEALIGGRLLNRIGALALILGLAFFFKYAVDQNWIGQGMRVFAGLLVGVVLLALAYRSHTRGLAIFGQGLVGAGQAMLYLSIYASFNFYHLVPQPVALTAMGLVTVLGFVQAMYYDSLAVSLLACVGGYLTPFLLDSGASALGTVLYVLLVNLGVLVVLTRKAAWIVLEPIALVATYAIYFSWYFMSYTSGSAGLAVAALSLFWGLFLAFDIYSLLTSSEMQRESRHVLGALNGVAYYAGLFALLGPTHRTLLALFTIAIGGIHVAVLILIKRRQGLDLLTAARYTLSAMVLLAVATAVQFHGFIVVTLWALEALPLVWFGTRARLWYVWRPALILYALGLGLLFATPDTLLYGSAGQFRPLLTTRALAFLVLAASCAAGTIPFNRMRRDGGEIIANTLHSAWILLVFILLAAETNDLFRRLMVDVSSQTGAGLRFERSLTIALLWMALSLALLFFGTRIRRLPWIYGALATGGAAVALGAITGIAYEPVERFVPVFNVRVGAFTLLVGALVFHRRWMGRVVHRIPWMGAVRVGVESIILLLPFELVTAEINDFFQHRLGHSLISMDTGGAFIELALLAGVWMLYALLPTWYGVGRRTMPLITIGLSMGAGATGLAAFAGTVFQPAHQLSTILGVRPVVLVLLVSGLTFQLRWLRDGAARYRWTGHVSLAIQAAIIVFGFALITAETRDAFSLQISSAGGRSANSLRDLERLAFSLVWLAYAIVVVALGIWRRVRWMRIGALALFACIIVKVFVYDLSFLGAVYRPVSFGCLGVILLAVSYLYSRYRGLLLDPDGPRDDPQAAALTPPPVKTTA